MVLELRDITKSFNSKQVIQGIDLTVKQEHFVTIRNIWLWENDVIAIDSWLGNTG